MLDVPIAEGRRHHGAAATGSSSTRAQSICLYAAIILISIVLVANPLVLSLVAMASSAYVKWRIVAAAVSLAVFFILSGVAEMIDQVFRVTWGHIIDPAWSVNQVSRALLGIELAEGPGAVASAVSLGALILILALVIERKLRPVEIVS